MLVTCQPATLVGTWGVVPQSARLVLLVLRQTQAHFYFGYLFSDNMIARRRLLYADGPLHRPLNRKSPPPKEQQNLPWLLKSPLHGFQQDLQLEKLRIVSDSAPQIVSKELRCIAETVG